MKKYLILLFFIFFLIPFTVFANNNYNTQYNINIPNYDEYFSQYSCGTENVKDFLHNFIDNYNYSPHLLIFPFTDFSNGNYEGNTIMFLAYSLSNTQYNRFSFYGVENGTVKTGYLFNTSNSFSTSKQYILNLDTCDSNISTSNSWLAFKSFLSSVSSSSSNVSDNVGTFKSAGSANTTFTRSGNNLSFDNNNSFTINSLNGNDFYKSFVWPYWSDRSLQYKATIDSVYSSSTAYFKKLHIVNNDTTYDYLDYDIPTFYDVSNTFVDNRVQYDLFDPLENALYNNFSPNELSNFNFTLSMNSPIEIYQFVNNFNINWSCFGRVNHNNNYYTYERISCDYQNSIENINNSTGYFTWLFYDLNFYDSNDNLITNFSNYDRLFVFTSLSPINRSITYKASNLEINHSVGSMLYSKYYGMIYDYFDNLQPLFKFYLSSNRSYSYDVYGRSLSLSNLTNTFVYWTKYNSTSLTPTDIQGNLDSNSFNKMSVSNSINSSIMVYQDHIDNIISKIEFIFNEDLIISYSGSNSNSFYYIDSNGDIQNSNITVDYDYNHFSNNYDISYYVNHVNNFINGLSSDSEQLSLLTQQFYDSSPTIIQAFIFVLFILSNIYFVYLLMRK